MIAVPPSYAQGFAPRDFDPHYPELWRGCWFATAAMLGPVGSVTPDWSGHNGLLTVTNPPAGGLVVPDRGRYCYKSNGTGYISKQFTTGVTTFPLTLACWYRLLTAVNSDGGEDVQLMGLGNSSDDNNYFFFSLYWAGGRGQCIRALAGQSGVGTFHVEGPFTHDFNWHHACYVFHSAGVHSLYVDGRNIALGGIGGSGTEVPQGINTYGSGALLRPSVYGPSTKVLIDDSRVYNRSVPQREAQLLSLRRGIAYEPKVRQRISLTTFGPPPEPLSVSVTN